MNISFDLARKLGIGILLGLVLLEALVSVMGLSRVEEEIHQKVEVQETKERHFMQVALLFAGAGADFYRLRAEGQFALAAFQQPLDTIHTILAELRMMPLSTFEQAGIGKLAVEEKRFRTALSVFAQAREQEAPAGAAVAAVTQVDQIITGVVTQALQYSYVISKTIAATNDELLQTMGRARLTLSLGAGIIALVGLCVSVLLSRTLRARLADILRAVQELSKGNLGFRIRSPFTDEVGRLANGIDEMAAHLEDVEQEQQDMLKVLTEAKHISDAQAHQLVDKAFELERARQAAESASQAKTRFLATMSHELRTPMNGVLGMTELLLNTNLSDQQRRFATTVRQSGELLLHIINDILDFSKIEAGKLELAMAAFDLRATIESVTDLVVERAHRKGLELICTIQPEVPSTVWGDALRLRQILSNLLSNAVKFTPQGEVSLRVTPEAWQGNAVIVRFDIQDTGIGIAPEVQEHIFESFTQAEAAATTRQYGGTGLGLAIAKQLATMMGGTIGVHSRPGQGSTFWFTLRLATQPAAPPAAPVHVPPQGLRVLIVDDHATHRHSLRAHLGTWKVACAEAASGPQALDMLRTAVAAGTPYDLVMMDRHMPEMDGLALARAIKEEPEIASVHLVLLTAVGLDDEAAAAARVGIAHCLSKPVHHAPLYDCLVACASHKEGMPVSEDTPPLSPVREPTVSLGHVLLVEDNAVNQEVAMTMLESLGYRVTVADNGRSAVEALVSGTFDLVFMDCQMPEMDGFTATRAIREHEAKTASRPVPIIALTANAFAQDREQCLQVGMDGYLSKPYTLEQLRATLVQWLGDQTPSTPALAPVPGASRATHDPASPATAYVPPRSPLDRKPLEALRALQQQSGTDILRTVIRTYLHSTPPLLVTLREALIQGDTATLWQTAHSLKSSSANVGAQHLATLCKHVEALGRANTFEGVAEAVTDIETEYVLVREALTAELCG